MPGNTVWYDGLNEGVVVASDGCSTTCVSVRFDGDLYDVDAARLRPRKTKGLGGQRPGSAALEVYS